jgi:GNAT superfamily N-acetyltransferase
LTIEANDSNKATIRPVRAGDDAERIAALCQQLGYPASQEEVQRRLNQIQQHEQHAVYVAELSGHVIGWVHAYVSQLVVADPQAEIGGLVVDEGHRRCGVGRLLMQQAEQWAREKGCWAVYLRSNVVRKDAHAFYEGVGYSSAKTSMVFRKAL